MDAKLVDQFLRERDMIAQREKQIISWLSQSAERLGHKLVPIDGKVALPKDRIPFEGLDIPKRRRRKLAKKTPSSKYYCKEHKKTYKKKGHWDRHMSSASHKKQG